MQNQYREYRSIPFWSWNGKLNIDKLKKQIRWMEKNGMGGYFMHARSGLQTEYLSDEWMNCIKACVSEGESLGMKSWLYDENGWPSGFAGGKLLDDEANRDKYILAEIGDYDATATVSYQLNEDTLIRVSEGEENKEYLNLYIHTATSTADILNPKVVAKFIALTHERYKEEFGEQFSEKIEGFFTDEPQYQRWHTPYTNMVEEYWKEHFQEDILNELGLLFVEKDGYRSFRYRYWKAMQELMLNSFAKQIYEWCDKNDVKLTGHYIEECGLGWQMLCCAGIMPFYEYQHIPGIDWLGKGSTIEISARQAGSVAAQMERKQVLTETFACTGWDVAPRDLRRIAGFQYVTGVNLMCQHLVPYSERGSRKYDHPSHFTDLNPWVKEDFKSFNDYFTKLGYYLGEGEKHVNVAMLHPIRSAYFDYKREDEANGFGIMHLDERFKAECRELSSRGIDFHFLDEVLLAKHGFVNGARIGCGKCEYEYLVLPSLITMDQSTERLLCEYVKQGGKVLLLGEKPSYLEGQKHSYEYLKSNVTMEDVTESQPYRVRNLHTQIYSTYRTMNDNAYLYIVNADEKHGYEQTYELGEDIKSFIKVDLTDMSKKSVPLTIYLNPGEDAFLIPSREMVEEIQTIQTHTVKFQNAEVFVKENFVVVDKIQYSLDGNAYSKPWPCPALFQKLLVDRYQGDLYLKYTFDVKEVPKKIYLQTERSRDLGAWINGYSLENTIPSEEDYANVYEIHDYVKEGINEYIAKIDWYQSEHVFYALFGENVTESLKNCLVYDTELQPIQLRGQFGVYPKDGYRNDEDCRYVNADAFYIAKMPERITEPSVEGFPFFAGEMTLRQNVEFSDANICLYVPGDYQMAYAKINEKDAGRLYFDNYLNISEVAIPGVNMLEIRFVLGNRNLMGPHHFNGDREEEICPDSFEMVGTWQEDKSVMYHEHYDIKKIF